MEDFLLCYLPPEMKEGEGPAAMHFGAADLGCRQIAGDH
jgi:hypothetical protein